MSIGAYLVSTDGIPGLGLPSAFIP